MKKSEAIAISYINEEDLNEYEYGDISVRFKSIYLLKEMGYKGIKLETTKRDLQLITPFKQSYNNTDEIEFHNKNIFHMLNEYNGEKNPLYEFYKKLRISDK